MLSLLEIADRSQRGPKMDEKAWNIGLFHKMNELAERYQIYCPKDAPVFNVDDSIADRAFRASVDFLVETGVFCVRTNRVIQFTESEVLDAIKGMPKEVIIGEGKDTRILKKRRIEEREELNHCPGFHGPFSQEHMTLVVKNFAQIPTADYLEGINFAYVDGYEIYGMAMEAYAARREVALMREGATKAGRPGLAIAYYPINTRASALLAPIDPKIGLRPSDGILLSMLPDVKVEPDYLTAAIVYDEYGCFKLNGNCSGGISGFAGSIGGAIIEAIVHVIAGWMIYHDTAGWGGVSPGVRASHIRDISLNFTGIWASSVWVQAVNRNTNFIMFRDTGGFSGAGNEAHLLEVASKAICHPINGCNVHITRQSRARMNAGQSPLDAEFSWEVATAVMRAGLTRETAGALLRKLDEKYLKGRRVEAPYHDIREFYDLVHHRPLPEFEKAYLKVKEQLASLGLDFS